MKREMTAIKVYASDDGMVIVSQDVMGSDDHFVCVPPAQAKLLCKWIAEVADEIEETSEFKPEPSL